MLEKTDQKRRRALRFGVTALAASGGALAAAAALGEEQTAMSGAAKKQKDEGDPLTRLVGMKLRVVKPGEFVTQEFNPDRLTIGVDADMRIRQIYVG